MRQEVRASCATCGAVQLPVDRIQLVLARPDLDGDRRNVLEFTCPSCQTLIRQRVTEYTTHLLASSGVLLVADSAGGHGARGSGGDRATREVTVTQSSTPDPRARTKDSNRT